MCNLSDITDVNLVHLLVLTCIVSLQALNISVDSTIISDQRWKTTLSAVEQDMEVTEMHQQVPYPSSTIRLHPSNFSYFAILLS